MYPPAEGSTSGSSGGSGGSTSTSSDCVNDFGTHASGMVAGYEFGTAKDADIVSVGVQAGCDEPARVSDLLSGLSWIKAHHSNANDTQTPSTAIALLPYNVDAGDPAADSIKQSIDRLTADGVLFAVAAGDAHRTACSFVPANMPNVITVGGIDVEEGAQSATPWAWTNFDSCVDILAPAVKIRSASPSCFECTAVMSRTANAAASVAGVMASFVQSTPDADFSQVRQAVVAGSTLQLVQNPQFPYQRTTRRVLQTLLSLSVFEVKDVTDAIDAT